LLEIGDHASAAAIFEQLARGAHDRGRLQHAPNLYLQAARANLLAGNAAQGKELVKLSLGILAELQRWPALRRFGQRIVDELQQFGQPEFAAEISAWLTETLPESVGMESHPGEQPRRGILPLKCPFCGGVLRPDEIEMLDEFTGECSYCGSAIRKE